MKSFHFLFWSAVIFFAIYICTSCTEEVIVPGPERIVYRDTSTYKSGPTPQLVSSDTTATGVTKTEKDTIIVVQIHNVYHTVTVTEYDTIDHYIHEYLDTAFVFVGYRPVISVPDELRQHVSGFFTETFNRQITQAVGGPLLITYVTDLPGVDWNSHSYWLGGVGGQMVIEVNGELSPDNLFTPIYRELARLQMNKKYTRDNTIMDPTFDPFLLTQQTTEANKPYLNILFN